MPRETTKQEPRAAILDATERFLTRYGKMAMRDLGSGGSDNKSTRRRSSRTVIKTAIERQEGLEMPHSVPERVHRIVDLLLRAITRREPNA